MSNQPESVQGSAATDPTSEVIDPQNPPARALVILPFATPQQAEQFAVLVMHQFGPEFAVPIVTTGTAYEYLDTETGATGQVFELFPDSGWEAFIKEENEQHHVLQRTIK